MERLKQMKDALMNCVSSQINGHLDQVDAKELGEAVDMIKDLEEAIYYGTITKAMEEQDKHEKNGQPVYYTENIYPRYMEEPMYYRRDRDGRPGYSDRYYDQMEGTMYYNGGRGNSGGSNGSRSFHDFPYDRMMEYPPVATTQQDPHHGKSYMRRKAYMDGKMAHHEKGKQIQELEKYMQELSQDITEMIQDASPEEKQILTQKLNMLATKIK